MKLRLVFAFVAALAHPACRAAVPEALVRERTPAPETAAIEAGLDALYRAFCFDAGGAADWATLRSLVIEGASFVAPIRSGQTPRAIGTDEFIADFERWIESTPEGLHERILNSRIDSFGTVAHAYVVFEGFVPGEEAARTRGLDSIQWVKDGERWKVASFTTQYEGGDAPVPARFLGGSRSR